MLGIDKCGNCIGGVVGGTICSLCNGTTFIEDLSAKENIGMSDEQPTTVATPATPEVATASAPVTAETPVDAAQTADAGVQAAPVAEATPATGEVNG